MSHDQMSTAASTTTTIPAQRPAIRSPHVVPVMVSSPDNVHGSRLGGFEPAGIQVPAKIRHFGCSGQVVPYHPPGFILHGENERLVEREPELVLVPDRVH